MSWRGKTYRRLVVTWATRLPGYTAFRGDRLAHPIHFRSRRCTRLRLAPRISAGRPSVLLLRRSGWPCGSALRVPPLLLRRYVIICSSSAAFIPGRAAPAGIRPHQRLVLCFSLGSGRFSSGQLTQVLPHSVGLTFAKNFSNAARPSLPVCSSTFWRISSTERGLDPSRWEARRACCPARDRRRRSRRLPCRARSHIA